MGMIIAGVALWAAVHWFKRLMPEARAKMGDKAKGIVAVGSVIAIVLMVLGYGRAEFNLLWDLPVWARGVNNLMMLIAVFLFGMSATTGRLRGKMRHPMLWGVVVWALAHLLVNGDTPSLVLFGGLGAWALISMALINRAEPWDRPAPGEAKKDVILIIMTVVMFAIFAGVHMFVGPNPFG